MKVRFHFVKFMFSLLKGKTITDALFWFILFECFECDATRFHWLIMERAGKAMQQLLFLDDKNRKVKSLR